MEILVEHTAQIPGDACCLALVQIDHSGLPVWVGVKFRRRMHDTFRVMDEIGVVGQVGFRVRLYYGHQPLVLRHFLLAEDVYKRQVVRCDNTECGLPVFRQKAGRTLSDDEIKDLLTDGHTKPLKGFKSKQGKNFDAIVAFDGEYNTTFVFPEKKCKSSYPKKRK